MEITRNYRVEQAVPQHESAAGLDCLLLPWYVQDGEQGRGSDPLRLKNLPQVGWICWACFVEVDQSSFLTTSCMFGSWGMVTPGLEAGDLRVCLSSKGPDWRRLSFIPWIHLHRSHFALGAVRSSWERTGDAGTQIQLKNNVPIVWGRSGLSIVQSTC